jgi:ATP synthase protein I
VGERHGDDHPRYEATRGSVADRARAFTNALDRSEVVATNELTQVRRLAFKVVLGQLAITLAAAGVGWVLGGANVALSALLGGGISTTGSLAMAHIGFRSPAGASALSMLAALLLGEVVKLGVVIVLFVLVLTLIKTSAVAMFVTFAATFLVYWIVLASWLPRFSAGRAAGRAQGASVDAGLERELR